MSKRKIGVFYLPHDVIDNPENYHNVFDGMVVLSAVYQPCTDKIKYLGHHESFFPINLGDVVPVYKTDFQPASVKPDWLPS